MRYIAFPSEEGEVALTGDPPFQSADAVVIAETLEELDQKLEAWLTQDYCEEGNSEEWIVVEVVPHSRRTFTARMAAEKTVVLSAERS